MPRAKVTLNSHFKQYRRELEAALERALHAAARETRDAIANAPSRYDTQRIQSDLGQTSVERTRSGFTLSIFARDYRFLWFEKGTRRKLGRGGKTGGPNRGIKPQRFMRNAVRDVFPRLVEIVKREMPR